MTVVEINNLDTFDLLFKDSDQQQRSVVHQQQSTVHPKDPIPIFVDVGGYNGDTVTKALNINPNLRIVVIEPIKSLADIIQQKFISNNNITVINKAAWNKKCNVKFMEYEGWSKGLSTTQEIMTQLRPQGIFTNQISKYDVEVDTLDGILTESNINNVDFIKIDTEGAEEQVLQGFTKYHTANHSNMLSTRFHIEHHIINLSNILNILLEKGANIEKITVSRDCNVDNHIVGAVIGTFGTNKKATEIKQIKPTLPEIEKKIEKFIFPDSPRRVEFLIENAIKHNVVTTAQNGKLLSKDKILNIGCADCFGFRDLNLDITNVDIKDEVPPEYKPRAKFQIADAENLPFSDKQFNCAILGDILEHVKDPVQVLKEAKRVANNVYITVPNEWEWDKSLKPFENPGHVRFYKYETLKEDLDKGLGETYKIVQHNGGGWSFFCVSYETGHIMENNNYEVTANCKPVSLSAKAENSCQLNITTGPIPEPLNISNDIPKKLRIALISTPFFGVPPQQYGGLEQIVWDLAEALDELGHEITIFAPEGSQIPKHGHLITTGKPINTVNVDWFQAEKNAYEVYSKFITPDKYDIVHDNTWFGFPYLIKQKYPNLNILHQHHGGYSWNSPPNW